MLLNMVCQTFTGRYMVSRYRQVAKSINDGGLRRLVYISLALLLDVVIGVMVAYVVYGSYIQVPNLGANW